MTSERAGSWAMDDANPVSAIPWDLQPGTLDKDLFLHSCTLLLGIFTSTEVGRELMETSEVFMSSFFKRPA